MGKWTYELLKEEALKYKTFNDFFKNSRSAYNAARKMGIRKDITTHFIKWKTPLKWTYELLQEEALKYKTIKEFRSKSPNGYATCVKRKLIRELTTHMEPLGHRYARLVYVYEFPDNHAYVGLTYNKDKRHGEHMRDGRGVVYHHMKKTELTPNYKMVSNWYIPNSDAQNLERETYEKYLNDGWVMLNSVPCGSLGGNDFKYSDDYLRSIALKYKNRGELKKYDFNVYHLIIFRKLYSFLDHMEWNGNTTYDLNDVIEECKKYYSRLEMREKNWGLYQWVVKHKHIDVCFSHLKQFRKRKWDTNEAIELCKKYTYIDDFKKDQHKAFCHLKSKDYDFYSHLKDKPKKERRCLICNKTPNEVKFYERAVTSCAKCYDRQRYEKKIKSILP
jgi:hypothetical protein